MRKDVRDCHLQGMPDGSESVFNRIAPCLVRIAGDLAGISGLCEKVRGGQNQRDTLIYNTREPWLRNNAVAALAHYGISHH